MKSAHSLPDGRAKVDALNARLPLYCSAELSRHGKVCVYYREVGRTKKIRMREEPSSPAFFGHYAQLRNGKSLSADQGQKTEGAPRSVVRERTWQWLCLLYFEGNDFKALAPRGQKVRRTMLEATWREPINANSTLLLGDCPLDRFDARAVRVLRDRKTKMVQCIDETGTVFQRRGNLEAANSLLKYIRGVLAFAVEWHSELVSRNHGKDVSYLKNDSQGFHTWTLDEVAQYEARHPVGSKARLALALGLYTGQRRGDLYRLGRHLERDGLLRFTQEKNAQRKPVKAYVPVVPALQDIIDATPTGDLIYIVQKNGKPYAKESFGNLFRKWCLEAGLPHCSAHGLRKACVVRLIMEGCTPHQIMAITGHQTLKEIDRYAREYLREHAALQVLDAWLARHEAELARV